MASVVIFEPGKIPRYLSSANTPDYEGNIDVIINPDLTLVQGVEPKFWKRDVDSVVEMTQEEKQAVLDAELLVKKSAADTLQANMPEVMTALIKVINLRLPSNKITKKEMIEAIKLEIV